MWPLHRVDDRSVQLQAGSNCSAWRRRQSKRLAGFDWLSFPSMWVWVKLQPPGYGPHVLVLGSIDQGLRHFRGT